MGKILSIIILALCIIAGNSYGQPSNPFTKKDNAIYFEGWYGVDGSGKLTGLLTLDIINMGSSGLKRVDYRAVPDFYKCSQKPANWTCQYNPKSGVLSFIIDSGALDPMDSVSFTVRYNNPHKKVLKVNGSISYKKVGTSNKIRGVTRIEGRP